MPRTVAILGASADPAKFGYQSVVAHQAKGYQVYPVNPKGGEIAGLPVFKSLEEVPPGRLTRISVYLPPAVLLELLPAIATRGCDELWLNPGTDREDVVAAAEKLGLNPITACSIVALGAKSH